MLPYLLRLLLTHNEFSFCSFGRSMGSIVQPHELYQFTNKPQQTAEFEGELKPEKEIHAAIDVRIG